MSVAVRKIKHAEIALLNGPLVRPGDADGGSSFTNLKTGLKGLGHDVSVYDGTNADALDDKDVLVFPALSRPGRVQPCGDGFHPRNSSNAAARSSSPAARTTMTNSSSISSSR